MSAPPRFARCVGIDYSGAAGASDPLPGLRVCVAEPGGPCEPVSPPGRRRHWSRRGVAEWLGEAVHAGETLLVGVDHGFSMPESYFRRHGLADWPSFLEDFRRHWPTDRDDCPVEVLRDPLRRAALPGVPAALRGGRADEYRLCERWTASAKSVFHFDVQGSVAKSTHAGLPWLAWLRERCGPALWCWPFDGWDPPRGRSVIAEAYPSLVRHRYARDGRGPDLHDAWSVARWLADTVERDILGRYLAPPLTPAERDLASREGWILGVS